MEEWEELAKRLGWDGESESGMRNVIQNWEHLGPAKEGGQLYRKRAGIDGDSSGKPWPPENLYVVLEKPSQEERVATTEEVMEKLFKHYECEWCQGFAEFELVFKDTVIHGHEPVATVCERCAHDIDDYIVCHLELGYADIIGLADSLGWDDYEKAKKFALRYEALDFLRERFRGRNS